MTEKMLVTKALNELKLLDSRIRKEISNAQFVSHGKKVTESLTGNITKKEFSERAKAQYQSIRDLIERRQRIKSAVIMSNAITKVTINGQEMTVAEAIEKKKAYDYNSLLSTTLRRQFSLSDSIVSSENNRVEVNAVKLLETAYGKDKTKIDAETYNSVAEPYKHANEYEVIDPIGAVESSESIDALVDTFLSEVDTVLQVSNSTTVIEF